MKRFYPAAIPEFLHEPSFQDFKIVKKDDATGEGIISLTYFKANDIVCRFQGKIVYQTTLYSLQLNETQHIHDPYFMGKILHACNPNLSCDMQQQTFTALRSIKPNDFLTMDYEQTEDVLFRPFHCQCGSKNCKGWIAGRKQQLMKKQD